MRDKIIYQDTKFVVGKWSTGVVLSEWVDLQDAAEHSKAITKHLDLKLINPYRVYSREEWEGGFKA